MQEIELVSRRHGVHGDSKIAELVADMVSIQRQLCQVAKNHEVGYDAAGYGRDMGNLIAVVGRWHCGGRRLLLSLGGSLGWKACTDVKL